MEDKLKLAEIKGYVESCLNKFVGIPAGGPSSYFFKDLNAILDIIMDKQCQSFRLEELEFFNKQWQEAAERLANKSRKLYKENIELAEKLKQCEEQRNELYYAHTGREWK